MSEIIDEIPNENEHLNFLNNLKFEKQLNQLKKKYKNKKIVVYGAGQLFQVIKKHYNIEELNIVGISDNRYYDDFVEEQFGYKAVLPHQIADLAPDVVLVAVKFYINLIDDLEQGILFDTKIKIKPLVKKPFFTLLKEIWE